MTPTSRSIDPFAAALSHYEAGEYAKALEALSRIAVADRSRNDHRLLLGACLARMRRTSEAISVFEALLADDPACHEALTWMAALTKDPRDMETSLGYARGAVELRPDDATGHGALGTSLLTAGRPEAAIESLSRAVELAPDSAEHRHNLALAYLAIHRHDKAIPLLQAAIGLAPRDPQSPLLLASTFLMFGMAGRAIECLTEALTRRPNDARLHSALAGAYASIRNDDAAERHHRRAQELSPESRGAYATWLLNQGRFEESETIFKRMIREGADPAFAYYGLMQSRKNVDEAFVAGMESALPDTLRPRSEMFLHYALGRAEEQRKRFGEAMAHFDAANALAHRIHRLGRSVDPVRFSEDNAEMRRLYEAVKGLPGHPTDAPIFIIGMIRSGTTLLDQIVSSHPDVASGGELRFWMEESRRLVYQEKPDNLRPLAEEYVAYARLLSGAKPRFTDKMPLNYGCLGPIHAALPNARFLHIRRNPVDTCLSIWTTYFGQGALFAYDKHAIVGHYREYLRQMEHWRCIVPPDRLYELDYEELIAHPETVVPHIIEFLSLPWNDACLRHDQNASAINTPSRWQARQPIYRTSVERWRRYEPWLGEFASLLQAS